MGDASAGGGATAAPSMDLFFSELSATVQRKRQAEGFSAGACVAVVVECIVSIHG